MRHTKEYTKCKLSVIYNNSNKETVYEKFFDDIESIIEGNHKDNEYNITGISEYDNCYWLETLKETVYSAFDILEEFYNELISFIDNDGINKDKIDELYNHSLNLFNCNANHFYNLTSLLIYPVLTSNIIKELSLQFNEFRSIYDSIKE